MDPLAKALLEAGFSVQLEHDTTETSWEDVTEHGRVILRDATGKELGRRDGFQHNRKLRSGGSWDDAAVKEFVTEATKMIAASA